MFEVLLNMIGRESKLVEIEQEKSKRSKANNQILLAMLPSRDKQEVKFYITLCYGNLTCLRRFWRRAK
jgi:hypothetical protein